MTGSIPSFKYGGLLFNGGLEHPRVGAGELESAFPARSAPEDTYQPPEFLSQDASE